MLVQPAPTNSLLGKLKVDDASMLAPYFKRVRFPAGAMLEEQFKDQLVFPDAGVVSVNERSPRRAGLSVALVGSEGATGLAALLGSGRGGETNKVLVAGEGAVVNTEQFRLMFLSSGTLQRLVLRYVYEVMVQLSRSALAAGRARIDDRLARTILMLQDRLGGGAIPLTHDNFAEMLGIRRPGVTDALHRLEGDHLVRSTRGLVMVRDRAGLEALAGDIYGLDEHEYLRGVGEPLPRHNDLGLDVPSAWARAFHGSPAVRQPSHATV